MFCAASAGLGLLQYCNLNIFRTKFILGFSFFLGLSIPQYFREHQLSSGASPVHTHSRWVRISPNKPVSVTYSLHKPTFCYCFNKLQFNDIIAVIFTSHATVAVLVAVILDRTLTREAGESRKDGGSHWWDKFILYTRDVRSDDFYKLPFNLNKFFPPL